VIALIIIAVLALLFVALLWARSGQPENEGASLGHNAPYPDSVLGPSVLRPPLGSPESLESDSDPDSADAEPQGPEGRQPRGHS
jgi:hypothetical protein